jgi:hypothetical protein
MKRSGMPSVPVISIARSSEEFQPLRQALSRQTLCDFEFVGESGGTIPEAWNRAIVRAMGEILVFIEADASPVDEHWLEELANSVPNEKTIVKGLEVTDSTWDMANLAAHRNVFADARFDESFRWAEDTELFCRLNRQGFDLLKVNAAPVIHLRRPSAKRVRRAFRYGLYWAKLNHRYGHYGDPMRLTGVVQYCCRMLAEASLNLLGLALGNLIY